MIQEKQETQEKFIAEANYDLIKGEFSHEEAADIFNDLFYTKINFNEQRRFSQDIRFGEYDPRIDKRLAELRAAKKEVLERVEEAKAQGKTLKVSATINIELI